MGLAAGGRRTEGQGCGTRDRPLYCLSLGAQAQGGEGARPPGLQEGSVSSHTPSACTSLRGWDDCLLQAPAGPTEPVLRAGLCAGL